MLRNVFLYLTKSSEGSKPRLPLVSVVSLFCSVCCLIPSSRAEILESAVMRLSPSVLLSLLVSVLTVPERVVTELPVVSSLYTVLSVVSVVVSFSPVVLRVP